MKNAIKTESEITAMRHSGHILATILATLAAQAKAGMTPKDMSAIAAKELKRLGGEPVFKGFYGYPDIICISVNEQVQHSIPTSVPFKEGDVVNFDFGVRYKGMVTDSGITVCIGGKPSSDVRRLLDGTEKALAAGIAVVRDGCRVGDISAAIEHVLKQYRLGIVQELVGHGVGHELHEDPEIPNYGPAGRGPVLKAGMTVAIEPITTLGRPEIDQLHDGWTLVTRDGSWAAQFEHTLLVTKDGAEILTKPK
ncbi:MAG TPA: type I methionyl aminopeptidase [Candidatus Saccharimonadales bacterium]|nr:type I methionyl aminopeptidase [Candidatus Saccharimonadales bacterium]